MSEITTIMTVEMTLVQKVDESADEIVRDNYNERLQRGIASLMKNQLKMDDVKVARVQCFVREDN